MHRIALLALLTSGLLAQGQDAVPTLNLRTTDGDAVVARFISTTDAKVKLNVSVLGGTMTVTRDLDDFDTMSQFLIHRAANPPKDYAGHFALARRAGEMGLLGPAGNEGRAAMKLAQAMPDFETRKAELRKWASDALEKLIADAVAQQNLTLARQGLKILTTRFADQRTEEQLGTIAGSVEGLEQADRDAKAAAKQAKIDAKVRADNERKLKDITKWMADGEKDYQSAVRKSRTTTASKNLCEKAVEHFKKAYLALEEMLKKSPDDGELAAAAAPIAKQIHDQGIAAALHAANMLTVQSDYKNAMDWAQRVLKFDPDNAEAKAMVQTITMAAADASDDWGWSWPVVGRSRQ